MTSQEVRDAIGEAPSAAERLADCEEQLRDAQAALVTAETALDIHGVVAGQNTVAALQRMIATLRTKVVVEHAAEARAGALDLAKRCQEQYDAALDGLMPDIELARKAIKAVTDPIKKCGKSWNKAARAQFELRLVEMRFGLDATPLDVLPVSPIDALQAVVGEEIEKVIRLCIPQALPTTLTVASDSPEQAKVKGMVAAAEFVAAYAGDLKLSSALVEAFEKAGPLGPVPASAPAPGSSLTVEDDDPAFIGTTPPSLPPGVVQGAVGTFEPFAPETPKQKAEREQKRRASALRQADVARELGAEAVRIHRGLPTTGKVPTHGIDGDRGGVR